MSDRGTVNGIIWYKFFSKGIEKFERIVESYLCHGYEITQEYSSSDSREVVFSNGDRWKIKRATEGARGYKCNISYIDECVDKNIVRDIIMPCTMAYPYQAYNYY